MMKKIKPSLVLTTICLVISLLLAVVNMYTAPIIEEAKNAAANEALVKVYPGGTNFKKIDITQYTLPKSITAAYSEGSGGFVIQSEVEAYKPGLVIMCGIDSTGKIVGADYIVSNETLGAEIGLGDRFVGKTEDDMIPDIVAGSTAKLTTGAYYRAITDSLTAFVILNGGTADVRTPEKILQDNCNAALGTSAKTFTRWFSSWNALADAEVYVSEDGVVIHVSNSFIGYLKDSKTPVAGSHSEEALAAASAAYAKYESVEKIDKSEYSAIGANLSKIIVDAYKNADGHYMFLLSTKGFSYAASPIVIELIIDADGKIASCVTISNSESGGYGAICGEPEYYEQYNGKDANDYNTVPNITSTAMPNPPLTGGATETSNGYKNALRAAFKAYEILNTAEGGND